MASSTSPSSTNNHERLFAEVCDAVFAALARIEDDYPQAERELLSEVIMHAACRRLDRAGIERMLAHMHAHYRIGQPPVIVVEE
ncbi:hypothetical protein QA648_36860 (plasmid) [Rhizobium sp. CB3171]|uniref:hypothetical protein n=1 Tax=Rhizobium sp. CB3171 TaxID=3039157 RepID=UPI0024B1326B|nr:hypothetical protein [Rhizobium sp. CB3171]WFU07551.1 hypothetical protein QA648_36860 [Rhizobium sp. CB3171]